MWDLKQLTIHQNQIGGGGETAEVVQLVECLITSRADHRKILTTSVNITSPGDDFENI